jgi:galactose oxidase-like protein
MTRARSLLILVALVSAMVPVGNALNVSADVTVDNWAQQSPAQAPSGRAYAAMAYDTARGRTVLFGGGNGCCAEPNDTWEWDGSNWTTFFTNPSPAPSIGPGMAYDSTRGVTVLLDNSGHTWEWNGQSWVQRTTSASPPARLWTAMAYDSVRHVAVLFGGNASGGVVLGDTWTYDGSDWTRMTPANAPSARMGMAMSFDTARGVLVLFGGRDASGQRLNDTWEWDGTNWTQRTAFNATGTPYPRFWTAMAYDAQLGETVMFGGDHLEPGLLGPINDTWLWDGTSWTRDWTAAVPTVRAGQAMAQSSTGSIVLFGGTDEGNPGTYYNDTWEFGSGFSTPAGHPALVMPALSLYMGSPAIGATTTSSKLRITGGGTGPTLISSITTTGDFAVAGTDCPIAPNPLAVGAFCSVQVTYTPTVCGLRTGSLVFADNSATGSETINLEGGVQQSGCDADLALIASKDVTVNATSPAGATINYNGLSLFDLDEATPPPITCSPALNSTFPIGTTLVTCSASDSDDVTSTVTASFHVTVNDTDLALINVPSDFIVPATSPSGALVNYTPPTVLDEDANPPAVTCSPASGSMFPIAITTVTCQVSDVDDSPNAVTATFRVQVGDSDLALTNMPADVTQQATTAGGAPIGYVMPKAVDEDSTATVSCDFASGYLFPLGTTTVTCQASDPDDTPSTVTATFQVTIIDTDIGVSIPPDITVNATGPSGAVVTYATPPGSDEDGNDVAVSCLPTSGSIFPIGTSAVTCITASDPDDTPSSRSITFHITVRDTDLALTPVADITAVATSSAGATVTFTPPAVIDEDSPLPAVTCNWPTTYTFAVGTTTVICQVTDYDDPPYPSTVQSLFHVTVIPDLQLTATSSPTSATAHTTVTTTAQVTNIGATPRKTTITYTVYFVDSSGNQSVVATDKAVVTVNPGQTTSRSFSYAVKNSTPTGTYLVAVTATDDTGGVSQSSTFTVS